jgi:hypothetical protein
MGGYGMQNVRLASMKPNRTPAEDVRYRRNSGKHLLAMSSSQFDPNVWSGRALQVVSPSWR